jgi:hypothetical protein
MLSGGCGPHNRRRKTGAFTLVEVVIAAAIVAMVFGGIITAYNQSGSRLEWTGYSLAAEALGIQTLEQARAAVWDPAQTPPVNQLSSLRLFGTNYNSGSQTWSGYMTNILDVPYSSTNYIMATNYVSIQTVGVGGSTNIQIQVIRVDTVWPFSIRNKNLRFTNTISTIIAPDNRSASTF